MSPKLTSVISIRFRVTIVLLSAIAAVSVVGSPSQHIEARPLYKSVFQSKYKQYYTGKKVSCQLCHEKKTDGKTDTKTRKNYGKAVGKHLNKSNEKVKKNIDEALTKTEDEDSAIKGKTFGDLIRMGLSPNATKLPKKK